MNYRHAFHAGNVGDCVKHALLLWLLDAMARKPAPFLVIDTHAGEGRYDLSPEAQDAPANRTGEWRAGIARVLAADPPALRPYTDAIRALGLYPGSPALIAARLRRADGSGDRLAACELHPEDYAVLRRYLSHAPGVALHHRDGYAALRAFLPPPERRALVLMDPPFEAADEFDRIADAILAARARFPPVVIAAWYPIKHRAPVRAFHDRLRAAGARDLVAAELLLREPVDPARLNGCGVLIASPPWRLEAEAAPILAALLAALSDNEPGATAMITRIADE